MLKYRLYIYISADREGGENSIGAGIKNIRKVKIMTKEVYYGTNFNCISCKPVH